MEREREREREPLLEKHARASNGSDVAATSASASAKERGTREDYAWWVKALSCSTYLVLQVSGTIVASLSKDSKGRFPYDSLVLTCSIEATKFLISAAALATSRAWGREERVTLDAKRFAAFALPGLCYFVSNNCMLLIIRELGPTTYQITNNLKILSTGVLMQLVLKVPLKSLQWRALFILFLGAITAEMTDANSLRGTVWGYILVIINTFVAATGSVLSEKLLKGDGSVAATDSIHWQNMQLYFYGIIYGIIPIVLKGDAVKNGLFAGFNFYAWMSLVVLAFAGLTVSFILKYLDNIYKCFVSAMSMLVVAIIHVSIEHEVMPLRLLVSIALVSVALELYMNTDLSRG